jgi:hypothetical protein
MLDAGAGHQRFKEFFSDPIYVSLEHPAGIKHKSMEHLHYDLISSEGRFCFMHLQPIRH